MSPCRQDVPVAVRQIATSPCHVAKSRHVAVHVAVAMTRHVAVRQIAKCASKWPPRSPHAFDTSLLTLVSYIYLNPIECRFRRWSRWRQTGGIRQPPNVAMSPCRHVAMSPSPGCAGRRAPDRHVAVLCRQKSPCRRRHDAPCRRAPDRQMRLQMAATVAACFRH